MLKGRTRIYWARKAGNRQYIIHCLHIPKSVHPQLLSTATRFPLDAFGAISSASPPPLRVRRREGSKRRLFSYGLWICDYGSFLAPNILLLSPTSHTECVLTRVLMAIRIHITLLSRRRILQVAVGWTVARSPIIQEQQHKDSNGREIAQRTSLSWTGHMLCVCTGTAGCFHYILFATRCSHGWRRTVADVRRVDSGGGGGIYLDIVSCIHQRRRRWW